MARTTWASYVPSSSLVDTAAVCSASECRILMTIEVVVQIPVSKSTATNGNKICGSVTRLTLRSNASLNGTDCPYEYRTSMGEGAWLLSRQRRQAWTPQRSLTVRHPPLTGRESSALITWIAQPFTRNGG